MKITLRITVHIWHGSCCLSHTYKFTYNIKKNNNNKYVSPSVSQTTNFLNIEMMDNMQLTNNQTDWQTEYYFYLKYWQ